VSHKYRSAHLNERKNQSDIEVFTLEKTYSLTYVE
jgi:hypothetical protein